MTPPHVLKAAQTAANLIRYEESTAQQERIIARYMMAAIDGRSYPEEPARKAGIKVVEIKL